MSSSDKHERTGHPVQFDLCGQGYSLTIDEADALVGRIGAAIYRARQIVCAACQSTDGVSAECCGGDPEGKICPTAGARCPACPSCGRQGGCLMCSIDLEPCSMWSETERRARKLHFCSCCGGAVVPGQRYIVHFSVYEGSATSEKLCLSCSEDRAKFVDAHDGYTPAPGYFLKLLRECIHDGDPESDANWRPMLDAITKRGEQATVLR